MGKQENSLLNFITKYKLTLARVTHTEKKLSCRWETARRFMTLNISLALKITQGRSKWHCWVGRV